MKPNFALTLSFDGIGLLHRVPGGWHMVGDVALDAPDLAGALAVLRRTAIHLDSAGLRSKLVIPNEQIRYLKLSAPPKGSDMTAHVTRALDGATPYAVADLRFDWIVVGDELHVAAIARETLDEAESFAEEHDFSPVSFVAIPEHGAFPGEPFFGQTEAAARLIAPGDRLLRDTNAIRVLGRSEAPAPLDIPLTEVPPLPDTAPVVSPEDAESATPLPRIAAQDSGEDSLEVANPAVISAEMASKPDMATDSVTDKTASDPDQSVTEGDDTAVPLPTFSSRRIRGADLGQVPLEPSAPPQTEGSLPPLTGLSSSAHRPIVAELPPLPPRDPEAVAPPMTATIAPTQDAEPPLKPSPTPDPALRPAAFRSAPPTPTPKKDGPRQALSNLLGRLKGKPTELRAGTQPPRPVQPRATRPDISEKQRLTVFGARRPEGGTKTVRGKPRFMGLILTGVLLVFLASVAAWSSIFTETGLKGLFSPRDTAVAALPDTSLALDQSPPADIPDAATDDATVDLARLTTDDSLSDLTDDTLALDPTAPDLVAPPDEVTQSPEQVVDGARSSYAATGIWLIAPDQPDAPPPGTLDDLYLASIDTRLQNFDAVALPDARSLTDQRPGAQSSPAAPGTSFDLDARGLVIATPEGAETPEGAIVFAGRPAVTPPGMPTRFARNPDATTEADPLPALAATRPRLRPETLIESNERAQLGGLSRNELADLRPRLRPATLAAVALALREAAPLVDTDPDAETAEDEADALESATAQAIASSLKPLARPRDFSETVESSREASPAPQQQVAAAAVLAPQRNAAPQIPSTASVAQQATVRGAINLREVNLIGVYGQPSNRRALVRLSNGRYQKVQVGDRLDGGQVRAIGESELSYIKGNRSIVLTMPRG